MRKSTTSNLQTVYSFCEMGGAKVWDNTRCAFVFDHYAPTHEIKSAQNHREMGFDMKTGLKTLSLGNIFMALGGLTAT